MVESKPDEIVRKKEFHQKKSLGQHFLHDESFLNRIADCAEIKPGDTVVEIGPGAGSLTRVLAQRADCVRAVEVDTGLKPILEESLNGLLNVRVIFKDFLRVPWSQIIESIQDGPVKVTANIPYAITTDIVEKLLDARPSPKRVVLLMQKEAAERFISGPNTREYGPIPIRLALYTRASIEFEVPRGAFTPPPHVDSAVLAFTFLPKEEVPTCDSEKLVKLLQCAFSSRRKQIHNNIRHLFISDEAMDEALTAVGLTRMVRPESVTPQQYARMAEFLENQ